MADPSALKVLIVAQNASSKIGGEAFLPVKYFEILRRRGHPARLIAHARNRPDLSERLKPWLDHVHFIEDTAWHRNIWRLGRPLPTAIRKPVFGTIVGQINEVYQRRLIRRLVSDGKVDVIHQPIPVSPRAPSSLHGFGVPVVIGPMNGNMTYPPGYADYESGAERAALGAIRMLAPMMNWLIPGKRRAALLLVANDRTRVALPVMHPRVRDLVENGVDLTVWSDGDARALGTAGRLRLVFMGRLVRLKGLDFVIRALARGMAEGLDLTLDILGDGPERVALERLAEELGLVDRVTFHGYRPQTDCARILAASDGLVLASLHDCGGAVVLEAMSLGLPVIAADWGGPADYLDSSCGVLVSPTPRAEFTDRLGDAISTLARSPEMRQSMGEAGKNKIRNHFDWEKKVDSMIGHYMESLAAQT